MSENRIYIAIDLKSFYASVECAERGYDTEIAETARLTDSKLLLDDDRASRIDSCLQILLDNANTLPSVKITYFVSDERKAGGKYIAKNGNFRRLNESDRTVVFSDKTKIPIDDIYLIEGEIFDFLDE